MGLDILFSSKKNENEEVAYFRKHNHLLPYFGYDDNCSNLTITKVQVEDFVSDCNEVLEHWGKPDFEDVAKAKIPIEHGFFFGCCEYDEYYKQKLEEDLREFTNLLTTFDWDTDELVMYCWW